MSQNQFPSQGQFKDLDPELIKQILDRQQHQLRLEEIRLQQEGMFAEKLMDMNVHNLKNGPAQQRKTAITYATIGVIFLLVVLTFIIYCLTSGKDAFAKTFLNWISHFLTIAVGFWIGRSTAKARKINNGQNDNIVVAEVMD